MSDNDLTEQQTTAADGAHTTSGTPHGYSSLTPFIAVADAGGAVEWYARIFGSRTIGVTRFGDAVVHAEIEFDNGRLQLGVPQPDYHLVAVPDGDDACFSIGLYCPDTDALVARAVDAGATVREPATTFVSGDRFASIRDPFGVRWSIMTRVVDLSDEESAARVAEWAAQQG